MKSYIETWISYCIGVGIGMALLSDFEAENFIRFSLYVLGGFVMHYWLHGRTE